MAPLSRKLTSSQASSSRNANSAISLARVAATTHPPNDLFPAFFAHISNNARTTRLLFICLGSSVRGSALSSSLSNTQIVSSRVLEAACEESKHSVIERQFTIANTTAARLRLAVRVYEGCTRLVPERTWVLGEARVLQPQVRPRTWRPKYGHPEFRRVTAGNDLVDARARHGAQTLWATGMQEGQEAAKVS